MLCCLKSSFIPWLSLFFLLYSLAFFPPSSDWSSRNPGSVGWGVLVPKSHRQILCGESCSGIGQQLKIPEIQEAQRWFWLLYHSLRWQSKSHLNNLKLYLKKISFSYVCKVTLYCGCLYHEVMLDKQCLCKLLRRACERITMLQTVWEIYFNTYMF